MIIPNTIRLLIIGMRFAWSGANQQFESGEIDEEADYDGKFCNKPIPNLIYMICC